jgi:hypothetical protein
VTAPKDSERSTSQDGDIVDELPEDLDVGQFDGNYVLPNNNRRRIPAAMYLALGALCCVLYATQTDSPLVNRGLLGAGVLLVAFGIYGFIAGRTLTVDETEALATAAATVEFPVGHASAQMVWRGWLSRPVWRLLAYSSENPPRRRALLLVDGMSGEVVQWFSEDNPEQWQEEPA